MVLKRLSISIPNPGIIQRIPVILGDEIENKFTKDQAFYVDSAKFGAFPCKTCKYFIENENDPMKSTCQKVSENGGSNYIMAEGTCTLWNSGKPRFTIVEQLYGRGEENKGILPQKIRGIIMPKAREFLYPDEEDTNIPETPETPETPENDF